MSETPIRMPILDGTPANRYQLSSVSLHPGHDPTDPRVAMVEEMAIDQCGWCADGDHRWRDRASGEFCHADAYEASECEAHNTLRIAVDYGVPLYTGAELEFPEDDETSRGPHD